MTALVVLASLALASAGPAPPSPAEGLGDRQLAGQRIITGFPGQSPPAPLVRMIRDGRVAGVILFTNNFDSEAEAKELISQLRDIRRPAGLRQPLLIGVDQEGGLVKRLPGPPSRSAAEMGVAGRGAALREGKETGRYLRDLGFNLDFAPVLDLAVPGGEIERTDRGFTGAPRGVVRTGVAFAEGLAKERVAATAKHFPGFGRAQANTDDVAQVIDVGRNRLRSEDERPFQSFGKAAGPLVMLSNAEYPALDRGRPAGLSRPVASHELRRVAGFSGVSVTDSLDAAAITALGSPSQVARQAARAGTDLLLFSSLTSAAQASESLADELRRGRLERKRFRTSVERILALREGLRG